MTKKKPTNIGASVMGRLNKLARERRDDVQLLLTRYANERLLYRLAQSPHANGFVLKGAALFTVWTGQPHRVTRDIDLLGFGDPSEDHVRNIFVEILGAESPDDGVTFDLASMSVSAIREEQDYGGVRVVLVANVGTARVRLQIDVGFGDAITPQAVVVEFPALLDFPAPHLSAYPRETVVAEKLEAMVQLSIANSRMKDFYDVALLARHFDFDGELLSRAIRATFERRGTPAPKPCGAGTPGSHSRHPTQAGDDVTNDSKEPKRSKRRANGKGTIFRVGAQWHGKWSALIDGVLVRVSRKLGTTNELVARRLVHECAALRCDLHEHPARSQQASKRAGKAADGPAFEQAAEQVLSASKVSNHAALLEVLRLHAFEHLGATPVRAITTEDIEAVLIQARDAKGLARLSIKNLKQAISAALAPSTPMRP